MKYELPVGCHVDHNKIGFLFIFSHNARFRETNKKLESFSILQEFYGICHELNNNKVGRFRLLTSIILLLCVSQAYEYNNLVNSVWFSGLLSPKGNYNKALWLKGDKIIIQRTCWKCNQAIGIWQSVVTSCKHRCEWWGRPFLETLATLNSLLTGKSPSNYSVYA